MRVQPLWSDLQQMHESFESECAEPFLRVLRQWLLKNARVLPEEMTQTRPSIAVLLEGRIEEFCFQDQQHAMGMAGRILSLKPPRNIRELADTIDTLIEEFVVYTRHEICPICEEGDLRYWVDRVSGELFLSCPECGSEQDLKGKRLETAGEKFIGRPALKTDLQACGVICEN